MAKKVKSKDKIQQVQKPKVVVFPCKSMFNAQPSNAVCDNPIGLPCSKRAHTYKHVRKVGA